MTVLLLLLSLLGIGGSMLYVDQPLAEWLYSLHLGQEWPWLWSLTGLGETKIYLLGLLALALVARFVFKHKRWEQRFWFLWLCVAIPELVCVVIKIIAGRARPELWFTQQLYGFYGPHLERLFWSFPSGHTTTIMGFALGLCALFPRYIGLYLLLACAVVTSRVLLLEHYLSDVLMATWLCYVEIMLINRFKLNHG
jgi:membrane-associated phospholipid phosphatase